MYMLTADLLKCSNTYIHTCIFSVPPSALTFKRNYSMFGLVVIDLQKIKLLFNQTENKCLYFPRFRDDGSVFDGMLEEDEKDKAKR